MFVFTTKFNKKKAIAAVLVLAAVLVAIVLIAGNSSRSETEETLALSAVVKNNDQRVKFLKSLGWEVDKNVIEEQKVVIPREFSNTYKAYNELQISQGFDLSKYGGIEAMRYTYNVLNYPQATGTVVVDIIVYRNHVIAGDVQSNALDGFMVGLKYPVTASPSPSTASPSPSSPTPAATSSASPSAEVPNSASPNGANADALTSEGTSSESVA